MPGVPGVKRNYYRIVLHKEIINDLQYNMYRKMDENSRYESVCESYRAAKEG